MADDGLNQAVSFDVNAAVAADVDAAVAAATDLRLMGYACRESHGTPAVATFQIIHGATVSGGTVVAQIELAANKSDHEWYGPQGIAVPNGLSIDRVAGTVDVTLFYMATPPGNTP